MDSDSGEELREFFQEIDSAEVVAVILPALGQCLVLDSRNTADDPPQMSVSPPLGSGEQRLRELNRARPHLPEAQRLVAIPWTGSVDALVRSGVWQRLVDRMVESGSESAQESCQACLKELHRWERAGLVAMIRGQGPYHTLWSRAGKR